MGSSSSSKSNSTSNTSTSTTTTTNTKNINLQGVQGTQVFTDKNVSVTDAGAIAGSLNIGKDAVSGITQISKAFLDAQSQMNQQQLAGIGKYADKVTSLAETAATNDTAQTVQTIVKYGAGAMVVVAGVYLFSKGK